MSDTAPEESLNRQQILLAVACTAIALLIGAKLWQRVGGIPQLPWRWQPELAIVGLGIAIGVILLSRLCYQFWPSYRDSSDFYLAIVLKPLTWADLLWIGLLPGLSEELLFRGVALPAIGLNWQGIVISSVLFGSLHLGGRNQWPYALMATAVGLILGWTAVETGNLLLPITAHICINWGSALWWKLDYDRDRS